MTLLNMFECIKRELSNYLVRVHRKVFEKQHAKLLENPKRTISSMPAMAGVFND